MPRSTASDDIRSVVLYFDFCHPRYSPVNRQIFQQYPAFRHIHQYAGGTLVVIDYFLRNGKHTFFVDFPDKSLLFPDA